MKTPPVNRALAEQLRAALAGTKLEQHVYESDARAVADAQRKRKNRTVAKPKQHTREEHDQ